MWQIAEGELDKSARKKILKDSIHVTIFIYVVLTIVLITALTITTNIYRQQSKELIYEHSPGVYSKMFGLGNNNAQNRSSEKHRLHRLEKDLQGNEEYLNALRILKQENQLKRIGIIILYIIFCIVIFCRWVSRTKQAANIPILYCQGTCIERDYRSVSDETGSKSQCWLSIKRADGKIRKRIDVNPHSAKDIYIGDTIILIKLKGTDANPKAYRYRTVGDQILLD